ncbi:hypothetical protein CAPTEDRAFT_224383 [Capitella teleta]|uniref:BACK domain-containing protein n=1 Tax=Capitella teleta TaxID=283909 RepID=R7UZ04_CAPTE|nr:hypothetical protein CAPTEDRAFT_224383 [Capitella teleta]|eukprot:ELU09172.1 hypothetical protein CAPTEDRAFT_224383 [Capitella teleta]
MYDSKHLTAMVNGEGREEIESYDYLIILNRSSGTMRFSYTTVDPCTNSLAPKLDYVIWPRLMGIVDYASCVMKNVLFVTGGRDRRSGVSLKQVLRYEPQRGRWFECANMKTSRSRHVCVVFNGKIFVMGGQTRKNELTAKCESYEPYVDEWHAEEDMPGSRKDHRGTSYQGAVFVSGGASSSLTANDNCWRMSRFWPDPSKPQAYKCAWEQLKDNQRRFMPFKLTKHCMAMCHDRIFIAGGLCDGQTEDGVNFIQGDGAEDGAVIGSYRNILATAPMLVGYRLTTPPPPEKVRNKSEDANAAQKHKQLVPTEEPSTNWITNLSDMPEPRAGAGTFVVGHKVYVMGGHRLEDEKTSSSLNSAVFYHMRRKKWFRAFSLGEGNYREVECIQLTIPITNRDFRPMKYADCKWVLW